jgi:RNA polymerase sigma-70 factor, ECF subfamily
MQAVREWTVAVKSADAAAIGRDPRQEINSRDFLEALLIGGPESSRAFRKLVDGMHPPLARYIGRYFRDAELIQDVLQETFLAVHRDLPRFEGKSKLTTWVYSLAYHKICDRLADKYRLGHPVPTQDQEWDMESDEVPVDEILHQACLVGWIRTAALDIPLLYREAYRLRDVEGLSGEEAAQALGISTTLIRVRLHRARCLIVERIRNRYPGAFADGMPL